MSELEGCLVLVVEDEPMIALHIADSLKKVGARVVIARTLDDAIIKSEHPGLTAAVIDHALHGGNTTSDVCARLKERNIPFVVYSGFNQLEGACASGELVHKPAHPRVLVATLVGVLQEHQRPRLN
jgi:DNA-binding response OmpR family regulator